MPVLHSQSKAQNADAEGKQVSPRDVLAQRGPVLQVEITLPESIAAELIKHGKTIQPPVAGLGLVDTGAIATCVDEDAAKQLQLPVIDVVTMSSTSHASHPANVYPIRIKVAGLPMAIYAQRAIGAALKAQGLVALLGRDVLSHCTFIYNGLAGEITLCI
jgi:hypothetical protein